jgi:hypothetical protein
VCVCIDSTCMVASVSGTIGRTGGGETCFVYVDMLVCVCVCIDPICMVSSVSGTIGRVGGGETCFFVFFCVVMCMCLCVCVCVLILVLWSRVCLGQ